MGGVVNSIGNAVGNIAGGAVNIASGGIIGGGPLAPWNGVAGTGIRPFGSDVIGGNGPILGTGGGVLGDMFGTGGDSGSGSGSGRGTQFTPNGAPPALPQYRELNYQMPGFESAGQAATFQGQGYQPGSLGDPRLAQVNGQGLQDFRNFATGTGDSPWGAANLAQEAHNTANARGDLARQTASGIQGAQDRLAMGGGLSSGAAERINTQGMDSGLMARQSLENASQGRQNDIRIQDASARQDFLKNLPGQDLAFGNFDRGNADIVNRFSELNMNAGNAASEFGANAANQAASANAAAQNNFAQFNSSGMNQFNQAGRNFAMDEATRRSAFDAANYQSLASIYGGSMMANATRDAAANQPQPKGLVGGLLDDLGGIFTR